MICSQCSKEFTQTHGRQKYCSPECIKLIKREIDKKYRQSDKGKKIIKDYLKEYRQTDKYKKTQKDRALSEKQREYLKDYMKEYRKTDKYKKIQKEHNLSEKRKKYLKDYFKERNQSDKHKKKLKEYRQSDKGKKAFNKYFKERRKSDPIFKLAGTLRTRLKTFLTKSTAQIYNLKKTNETFDMVGCTPEFLKEYLEKQFIPGMSWQNHGVHGWHIDHIKPLDSAKNEEEVEKLMHYTNLQPMWATDNIKKGNKVILKK